MTRIVVDSSIWTGRYPAEPKREPPAPLRFQDDLARIANEHGTEFASKVAAAYNEIWSPRGSV
jgi:hypothetical protein